MEKPTYLGLLNAIAVAEQRGYEVLAAWADATPSEAVRKTLSFVANREREHAAAFAKRINELGFEVREKEARGHKKRVKKARTDASDKKKFEKLLGYGKKADQDGTLFQRFFDDESIDPQTGALLGRFIAEERDSGRRLRACYVALAEPADPSDDEPLLEELADRLDRLTTTLSDLKALREMP